MVSKVNLEEKLELLREQWSPRVVGELNGQMVKIVKCQGEYPWHSHAEEDELFWVVAGELEIRFRESSVTLRPGEFCVVPRGVEHSPAASAEAHVVLFEPGSTRNTGEVDHGYTIEPAELERL